MVDPKKRLTLEQIMEHSWMRQYVVTDDGFLERRFSEQLVIGEWNNYHEIILDKMEKAFINREQVIQVAFELILFIGCQISAVGQFRIMGQKCKRRTKNTEIIIICYKNSNVM